MKATLDLLARKKVGLLAEITVFLTQRGFQLRRHSSTEVDDSEQIRLMLQINGDGMDLRQIMEDLSTLAAVLEITVMPDEEAHSRLLNPNKPPKSPLNMGFTVDPSYRKKDLAKELADSMALLCEQFFQTEHNTFAYNRFTNDKAVFSHHVLLAGALTRFDPTTLLSREAKMAFWLNVFNSLAIHGIIAHDLKGNLMAVKDFFADTHYQINGQSMNLDIIEHGILRSNKRKYWGLVAPLDKNDLRAQWVLQTLDPRIHFAMYSACLSSPPLRPYRPETIDEQLRQATRDYLSATMRVGENDVLKLPKIFQWYKTDFGSQESMVDFIAEHLGDGTLRKQILAQRGHSDRFEFLEFDWTINRAWA